MCLEQCSVCPSDAIQSQKEKSEDILKRYRDKLCEICQRFLRSENNEEFQKELIEVIDSVFWYAESKSGDKIFAQVVDYVNVIYDISKIPNLPKMAKCTVVDSINNMSKTLSEWNDKMDEIYKMFESKQIDVEQFRECLSKFIDNVNKFGQLSSFYLIPDSDQGKQIDIIKQVTNTAKRMQETSKSRLATKRRKCTWNESQIAFINKILQNPK